MPYYSSLEQLALVRAASFARQQELLRVAQGEGRLETAEQAYRSGDVPLATRLLAAIARSRPKSEFTEQAKRRLEELAQEAQAKLAEVDQTLKQQTARVSASAFFSVADWPPGWQETVSTAFQQYDKIVDDYGAIPAGRRKLRTHVQQQRRRPEYAAALNEAEASTLWQLAREHEAEDHACCAYWVYQQATRLVPAPSAQQAQVQLTTMQKDPAIRAAAEMCRQLQWCHRTYNIADKLAELAPERAKELFSQVVQRSPDDTPVHLAARARLESLAP